MRNFPNFFLKITVRATFVLLASCHASSSSPQVSRCADSGARCTAVDLLVEEMERTEGVLVGLKPVVRSLRLQLHELLAAELKREQTVELKESAFSLLQLPNRALPSLFVRRETGGRLFHFEELCQTNRVCHPTALRIRRDGLFAGVILTEGKQSTLIVLNIDTGESRLVELQLPYDFTWSNDGAYLYVTGAQRELPDTLYLVSLENYLPRIIASYPNSQIQIHASQDSEWVGYSVVDPTGQKEFLVRSDSPQQEPTQLFTSTLPGRFVWFTQGQDIFFTDRLASPSTISKAPLSTTGAWVARSEVSTELPPTTIVDSFYPSEDRILMLVRERGKPALAELQVNPFHTRVLWSPEEWGRFLITSDGTNLRVTFSSPRTPSSQIPLGSSRSGDLRTLPGVIHKQVSVQSESEYVPVTLYRKSRVSLPAPTLIRLYGAYGTSLDPRFSPLDYLLMERGVVLAYVHIRGGGELGATWHNQARGERKILAVKDLDNSIEHLCKNGIADCSRSVIMTRSAGARIAAAYLATTSRKLGGFVFERPHLVDEPHGSEVSTALANSERAEWPPSGRGFNLPRLEEARTLPSGLISLALHDEVTSAHDIVGVASSIRAKQSRDATLAVFVDKTGSHTEAGKSGEDVEQLVGMYAFMLKHLF